MIRQWSPKQQLLSCQWNHDSRNCSCYCSHHVATHIERKTAKEPRQIVVRFRVHFNKSFFPFEIKLQTESCNFYHFYLFLSYRKSFYSVKFYFNNFLNINYKARLKTVPQTSHANVAIKDYKSPNKSSN